MKKDKKYLTVLSGGVGGAKFVSGLSKIYDNEFITVIGNIGDDTVMHGLSISPDIDILIYTLAGIVNTDCGWGIKDDTFNTLAALEYLGEPTWFRIGDNDFATHILRSALKQAGMSLTEITRNISSRFGLKITLLPPTSEPVRTRIKTPDGWLDFQEYYVKEKCKPDILDVRFDGALSATLTPEAYKSIEETDMFIIALATLSLA